MNILITGGAGFIGSHMVDRYCRDGHTVVVIDNLSSGRLANIKQLWEDGKIIFHHFSIEKVTLEVLQGVMELNNIEVIHHFAARPRVGYSVDYPVESNEQNISNTVRILDAARKAGVQRVVYSASSSAYGNSTIFPTSEEQPTGPLSPYALQKFVGEEYCRMFSSLYGLDTVCLRYFNVFGPRSLADSQYSAVIPIFIEQIVAGKSVTMDGTGEQSRDFTYVDNVVEGNLLAAIKITKFKGETINIACGDNISINGLVKELEKLIGKTADISHGAPRPGDAFKTQADISRARVMLDYEPVVSFSRGLKKTVKWYLKYLESK
jgi:UDP-glucose 4-epimerase